MLKVKSFKIEDDKGQNELISKYRLHEGSTILVSNGYVCVSYDDGEPMSNYQKALLFKEMKNKKLMEMEMAEFEHKMVEKQELKFNVELGDLREEENFLKNKIKRTKEEETALKAVEDKIAILNNKIKDIKFQKKKSEDNMSFIQDHIDAFDEMIKKNG